MTEKRYSRMTNHYGTSRTYCTGVYDNQNNRELKNTSQVITELNALHEENEQLKQENKQLKHWNKCLAEKRHQELSYRPYTASKSEKELKELLEPKLFNCSDRIKSDRYD